LIKLLEHYDRMSRSTYLLPMFCSQPTCCRFHSPVAATRNYTSVEMHNCFRYA